MKIKRKIADLIYKVIHPMPQDPDKFEKWFVDGVMRSIKNSAAAVNAANKKKELQNGYSK